MCFTPPEKCEPGVDGTPRNSLIREAGSFSFPGDQPGVWVGIGGNLGSQIEI